MVKNSKTCIWYFHLFAIYSCLFYIKKMNGVILVTIPRGDLFFFAYKRSKFLLAMLQSSRSPAGQRDK